jgi:rhodanese-related sulfurtransferase
MSPSEVTREYSSQWRDEWQSLSKEEQEAYRDILEEHRDEVKSGRVKTNVVAARESKNIMERVTTSVRPLVVLLLGIILIHLQLNELYDQTGGATLLLHCRGHLDSAIVPRYYASPIANTRTDDFCLENLSIDINDLLRSFEAWATNITSREFSPFNDDIQASFWAAGFGGALKPADKRKKISALIQSGLRESHPSQHQANI